MRNSPWSVLRERDFRLVWTASIFSDLGTWMQIGALAIFITDTTGQARWTGIAGTVSYLSAGLFTPFGGVLIDRFDRRKLIMIASFCEAVVGAALVVCFLAGIHSPLLLITIAGIQGIFGAVVVPGLAALVPDIVSKSRVAHATMLEGMSWNIGRAFGPIIGVLIAKSTSYSAVFVLNSLSFVAVSVALYFVAKTSTRHHEDGSVVDRLKSGWKGLRDTDICLWSTVIASIEIVFIAPFIALIPVMSQLTLHSSEKGSGILFIGQGVGSALGLFLIGSLMHRFGVGRTLVWSMLLLPAMLLMYALSPTLLIAFLLIVPLSGAHSVVLALAQSFMQRFAPDQVRGRALAMHKAVTITFYAVASSVFAIAADLVGLRSTFAIMAFTALFLTFWIALRFRALKLLADVDSVKKQDLPMSDDQLLSEP